MQRNQQIIEDNLRKLAIDELYVSLRKVHDIAVKRVIQVCTAMAIQTQLINAVNTVVHVKHISNRQAAKWIMDSAEKGFHEIPIRDLVKKVDRRQH